jgi:hypothetical protein
MSGSVVEPAPVELGIDDGSVRGGRRWLIDPDVADVPVWPADWSVR